MALAWLHKTHLTNTRGWSLQPVSSFARELSSGTRFSKVPITFRARKLFYVRDVLKDLNFVGFES